MLINYPKFNNFFHGNDWDIVFVDWWLQSSEEEVEEGGEKKMKKKEKKGLKEKCDDKPAQETEEKKGFLDKIKEKLPGGKKAEDVASPPPTPAPAAESATSPGAEKKGFMDKIKEKIPGYSKTGDEKEGAHH